MSPRQPSRSLVEQFPRQRGVGFASRHGSVRTVKRGGALALSLLAHVAVGAAVLHGGASSARVASGNAVARQLEIAAPELAAAPIPDEPVKHVAAPPAEPLALHAQAASRASARPHPSESAETSEPGPALVSAPTTAARFVLTAPISAPASAAVAPGLLGPGAGNVGLTAAAPFTEREVDVGPRLIAGTPPVYPASAEAAGVESSVPVELVIDARGAVQSAVGLGHVGYGLDQAALAAVRGYRFAPARRNGAPVAVRMRWVVRFELR